MQALSEIFNFANRLMRLPSNTKKRALQTLHRVLRRHHL
jgi:uncharacterized protein YciW